MDSIRMKEKIRTHAKKIEIEHIRKQNKKETKTGTKIHVKEKEKKGLVTHAM